MLPSGEKGQLRAIAALDIQSPWTFHLRNPRNPSVHQTHAGVLEFIADEGIVHLPAWVRSAIGRSTRVLTVVDDEDDGAERRGSCEINRGETAKGEVGQNSSTIHRLSPSLRC